MSAESNYPRTPRGLTSAKLSFLSGLIALGVAVLLVFALAVLAQNVAMHSYYIGRRKANCLSNVKQLATTAILYASDYDNEAPASTAWMDQTRAYTKTESIYRCPELPEGQFGYAINDRIADKKLPDGPGATKLILLFETNDKGRNAHGIPTSETQAYRHKESTNVAFADGQVKNLKRPE